MSNELETLRSMARSGYLEEVYLEGMARLAGKVEGGMEKAICNFTAAAECGHAQAQLVLGNCYFEGFTLENDGFVFNKDMGKAMYWWKKASEQGNESAKNNLRNRGYDITKSASGTATNMAYCETIRNHIKAEGKYKEQSKGKGQFAHVIIEIEPYDGEELLFETKVFGGSVPRQFFSAIEKGIRNGSLKGVLSEYPIAGVKVTLIDGSYHPIDSTKLAFEMAATKAFRKGIEQANPVIIEKRL